MAAPPWAVRSAYVLAIYNYVLAVVLFLAPVRPPSLYIVFGLLGTIAWLAGDLGADLLD